MKPGCFPFLVGSRVEGADVREVVAPQPCVEGPPSQILQIVLVGVGLAFEADGTVGAVTVAEQNEPHEPFDQVPEVEPDDEELEHLCRVDALVVDVGRCERQVAAREDDAEEVDRPKTGKGDETVADNHRERIVRQIYNFSAIFFLSHR